MIAAAFCLLAFVVVLLAMRRSLVAAIGAVLAVGYLYGILRANILQPLSHFIFDAAVLALYVGLLRRPLTKAQKARIAPYRPWMLLLIGWPVVLALLPVQDPLVQLVGLRGNVFLVPFLLVGALLTTDDLLELVNWIAVLNLGALVFAVAEYQLGIEPFFPRSPVTDILYASHDIQTAQGAHHRIPATFTSAHAFAGTMALGAALFIGALDARVQRWRRTRILLIAALGASVIGVFMAGARHPVILLGAIFASAVIFARMRPAFMVTALAFLGAVAWIINRDERMQRFRTLDDTSYVTARVQASVNQSFLEAAMRHPMGNGLGGGGTSMPYFLADRVRDPVGIENEYGRIMLEQGIPGLLIWLAFLGVTLARGFGKVHDQYSLGRRLVWVFCALSFGTAFIGVGLLASIPGSAMLLMGLGFVAAARPRRVWHAPPAAPVDGRTLPTPAGAGA